MPHINRGEPVLASAGFASLAVPELLPVPLAPVDAVVVVVAPVDPGAIVVVVVVVVVVVTVPKEMVFDALTVEVWIGSETTIRQVSDVAVHTEGA
jgi:hypothetical protein